MATHASCGDYLDNGYSDSSKTRLALLGQLVQAAQEGGREGRLKPKIAKKFLQTNDAKKRKHFAKYE